jgi:hypothetical protein
VKSYSYRFVPPLTAQRHTSRTCIVPITFCAILFVPLSYYDGPFSDHQGLYVDLDLHSLLGYTSQAITIPCSDMRLLKAGNPELVANYVKIMHTTYYHAHDMTARTNRFYDSHKSITRPAIGRILEQWDMDQGKAMHTSERSLQRIPQRYK